MIPGCVAKRTRVYLMYESYRGNSPKFFEFRVNGRAMLTPTNLLCRGRRPQRPENVGSVLCCLLRNTPPTTTVIARSHPKVTTWQSLGRMLVSAFVSDRSYQEIATGLKGPRNDKTSLVVPNFTERQDRMKKDCCILQQSFIVSHWLSLQYILPG